MDNLIFNIKKLISELTNIHDVLVVESIKNQQLKPCLKKINQAKETIKNILIDLKNLDETNPNMFICYDNGIYLSVIKKRYVISKQIEDNKTKVLDTDKKLKGAIEKFYFYSYGIKKKDLKKIIINN